MNQELFDQSINAELPNFDLDNLKNKLLGPPFIFSPTILDQLQQ